MAFAYFDNDQWNEITGNFTMGDETYTLEDVAASSVEALEELNIFPIQEDDNPELELRGARTLTDDNGIPRWRYESLPFVSPQEVNASLLRKRTIEERIQQAYQKGFRPNHPKFANLRLQCRDSDDKANWLAAEKLCKKQVEAGQGDTLGITFRTLSNVSVTVSFAEGLDILDDLTMWGLQIMSNGWVLKDAEAAGTPYDIEVGWPE